VAYERYGQQPEAALLAAVACSSDGYIASDLVDGFSEAPVPLGLYIHAVQLAAGHGLPRTHWLPHQLSGLHSLFHGLPQPYEGPQAVDADIEPNCAPVALISLRFDDGDGTALDGPAWALILDEGGQTGGKQLSSFLFVVASVIDLIAYRSLFVFDL